MRAQSDYGSDTRSSQVSGAPSEWMTVAEMQEYMHAGRTKAYELVRAGEVRTSLDRYIKANGTPGDQTGC